jgi:hypothetical protein
MCLSSVSTAYYCVCEDRDVIADNFRNVSFTTPRPGLGKIATVQRELEFSETEI